MEWFTESFEWIKNNLELLKWIGLGIVLIMLSPILIGIIKSLINGVVSIVQLIISILSYPFKLIKKISNVFGKKKKEQEIVYPNSY